MKSVELTAAIKKAADTPLESFDEEERVGLVTACESLIMKCQSPFEAALRFGIGGNVQAAVLQTALAMRLFEGVTKLGSSFHVDELTKALDGDGVLILRLMRLLASMGFFDETGKGTYAPTRLAYSCVANSPMTQSLTHFASQHETLVKLPAYLESTGFKNPDDGYDGPFQSTIGRKTPYFEWLKENPKVHKAFNIAMSNPRTVPGADWWKLYPVEQKLDIEDHTRPLIVDVGGGLGHQLIRFKSQFPHLPGKLIDQDLPDAIEAIQDLPEGIEPMKHSFFNPQPVEGAKVYYFRSIFHDWPDKQARLILQNLKAAMGSDSILLINDIVLPEENVTTRAAVLDMIMMTMLSALERTETQFRDLLESEGFEVIGIYRPKTEAPGSPSLIEAILRR